MGGYHSLLVRQLKKSNLDVARLPPEWCSFIESVNAAYRDFDVDRAMLERSIELSAKELQVANAQMGAIFRAVPDLFLVLDNDALVLDSRGGTDSILLPHQAIGKRLFDLPVAGRARLMRAALGRMFTTREPVTITYPVEHRGARLFFEARLIQLTEDRVIAVLRNVTEARRTLLALREQRLLFETVLRQAAEGIVVCSEAGQITFVNGAARRMAQREPLATGIDDGLGVWGRPRGGEHPGEAIPSRALRRALQGETCTALEAHMVWDDGHSFDVLASAAPILNLAGHVTGAVLTLTDISERKAVEEELRESEERFRQIAENFPHVIWLTGSDRMRLEYASPAYERLWGRPLTSIRQDPLSWMEAVHSEDRERVCAALQTELQGEFQLEFRIERPDGTLRFVSWVGFPIRDASGAPFRFAGLAEDVSEQRMLHAQLVQSQKLESIGQLAAGIAHEINTPTQYVGDNTFFLKDAFVALQGLIARYRGLLAIAKRAAPTQQQIAEIEQAERDADLDYLAREIPSAIDQSIEGIGRVTKIVRSMKEFSHPGSSDKTPLDLNRAIENTISVSRNEWKYVAEIVCDLAPDLPLVPVLAGEFNQVILNIIVNAAHAIGDVVGDQPGRKGTITISTRRVGETVEVRVTDTGTGIPESIRQKIFDPFFTTKPLGKGTGQGLAIARSVVVDKHGGSITCDSKVGTGTTFLVCLPLGTRVAKPVGAPA